MNTQLNWLALVVLIVATAFNHYWVWGLLFIFWAIRAFNDDGTQLLLPVSKRSDPLLYWAINIMWLVFGIWYILFDVLWRLGIYTILGFDIYPSS